MALVDDFKDRFPNFDTAQVEVIVPNLENVWPYYYGRDYENNKEIVLNLVAHLFVDETSGKDDGKRFIQSKNVGNVSISYGDGPQDQSYDYHFFRTTKYGRRFLMMIKPQRGAYAV